MLSLFSSEYFEMLSFMLVVLLLLVVAIVASISGARETAKKRQLDDAARARLAAASPHRTRAALLEDAVRSFSLRTRPHAVDDSTRDCLIRISVAEGWASSAPRAGEYLRGWLQRAAPEHRALADELRERLRSRERELSRAAAAEASQQRAASAAEAQRKLASEVAAIVARQSDTVARFLELAHRKVSLRDEYGDEDLAALEQELSTCVRKLLEREGLDPAAAHSRDAAVDAALAWGIAVGTRLDPQRRSRKSAARRGPQVTSPIEQALTVELRNRFLEYHAQRPRPFVSPDFQHMSGSDFEAWLAALFTEAGYSVSHTGASGDQGADLILRRDGRVIAVQAKYYDGPVGNAAVQQAHAAVSFYRADEGWVVTTSSFTPGARALAQQCGVRLIEGSEIGAFRHSPSP